MPTTIKVLDSDGVPQTINTNPALGQALAAASLPVVLASDQPTIPVATNAEGTIGAGSAPSKSLIGGGIYNASRLTLASGQGSALQLDSDGSLYVNVADIGSVATSAKQDTQTTALGTLALENGGNLAAILAKIIAAPATAAAQATLLSAIQAGLYPSENHIGFVSGSSIVVTATFNRPANATAYAALASISDSTTAPTILTFANMGRVNAGSGYITKARLITNQSTNTARYRLHLYNVAPTAINDGAAYTNLSANKANKIGYIDFDPMATEGAGSDIAESLNATCRLAFLCAAASRTLYGALQTKDVFTPASGQTYFVELTPEQN
jgi:hypothetical protein